MFGCSIPQQYGHMTPIVCRTAHTPSAAVGMFACPESPAYLQAKGRRLDAEAVATRLWGSDGSAQLGTSIASKGGAEAASLFSPTYRKGVLMGCLLFLFQQFSGINAIVYFSSSVFKQVSL